MVVSGHLAVGSCGRVSMVLHMRAVNGSVLHLLGKLVQGTIALMTNNGHLFVVRLRLRLRLLRQRLLLRLGSRAGDGDGDRLDNRVALGLGFGRVVITEVALELGEEARLFRGLGRRCELLLDGLGSGLLLGLCWLSRLLALDRDLDRTLGGSGGGDSGGLTGRCDGCDGGSDAVDRGGLGAGLCSWNLCLVHVW